MLTKENAIGTEMHHKSGSVYKITAIAGNGITTLTTEAEELSYIGQTHFQWCTIKQVNEWVERGDYILHHLEPSYEIY